MNRFVMVLLLGFSLVMGLAVGEACAGGRGGVSVSLSRGIFGSRVRVSAESSRRGISDAQLAAALRNQRRDYRDDLEAAILADALRSSRFREQAALEAELRLFRGRGFNDFDNYRYRSSGSSRSRSGFRAGACFR